MEDQSLILVSTPPVSSKEELAYEALKEAIIKGRLKPNEVVNQSRVAKMLELSSIPVRSAMSRLVSEGFLVQELHHSPRVSPFSLDQLKEILVIRDHLETLATAQAVPNIGPVQLAELNSLIEQMGMALESQDLYRYGSVNRAFHLKVYSYCPYSLLKQMIRDLWDKADIHHSRSMFIVIPGLAHQSHQEHLELMHLIETGQANAAAELMARHKARALNTFLEDLKKASVQD